MLCLGKFKTIARAALALLTVIGSAPLIANAQSVPEASAGETISSWDTGCNATHSGAGTVTGGCTLTSTGDVSVSAYYVNGTGSVSAIQSSYATTFNEQEIANATVTSYFEVVGPANPGIPLVFSATGTTSVSAAVGSYGYATASVLTGDRATTIFSVGACSMIFYDCGGVASTVGLPSSFNVNQSLSLAAGTLYAIVVNAQGSSNAGGFSASVDPSVAFAPGFNSTGYSIVYSSDLSPAPVPVPAAAWLLLSGVGGLGAMVRRRGNS